MSNPIASTGGAEDGLRDRRVIVTGASGFVGLHLCRALLLYGCDVHALSRSEPKIRDPKLHWHKIDLTDLEASRAAFARIRADFVWHLCSYAQGEGELALVLPTFRGELETTVNVLVSATDIGCHFFNDTASTEISTLSLHDALPIARTQTTGTCRA